MKNRPLCFFAKQRKTFRERLPMSEITRVVSQTDFRPRPGSVPVSEAKNEADIGTNARTAWR
jgi:hypothetical protein